MAFKTLWTDVSESSQEYIFLSLLSFSFLFVIGVRFTSRRTKRVSRWLWTVPLPDFTGKQRLMIHLFICFPIRILVAFLVFLLPRIGFSKIMFGLSPIPFVQSGMFLLQYVDTNDTGQFGGPAWWAGQRPVHVLTYLAAGVLFVKYQMYAFIPFGVDVILSIVFTSMRYGNLVVEVG